MPKSNVLFLVFSLLISGLCYSRADQPPYARFFGDVLRHIRAKALEQTDERRLYEAALSGMLDQLDPYSGYSSPSEAVELDEEINQHLSGIGVQVAFDKQNRPVVISPIQEGPAAKAGVRSGDQILAVDGKSVLGLNMEGLVRAIKGPPGSSLTLTLARAAVNEPIEMKVRREDVRVSSIIGDLCASDGTWSYLLEGEPSIGYARILEFGRYTAEEMALICQKLNQQGVQKLVMDLRGNTGGLLESAVGVCDLFLNEGVIVSQRDRQGNQKQIYLATSDGPSFDGKVVVLVDGGTASASEIVAGCLQDHKRAKVVGSRTYGKGTVQDIIPIERRRAFLRLTTSGYWRPSGKNIHRHKDSRPSDVWGVMPDAGLEILLDGQQTEDYLLARRIRDFPSLDKENPVDWSKLMQADPALAKGISILNEANGPKL